MTQKAGTWSKVQSKICLSPYGALALQPICSVQFSPSVMSDSLQPHGLWPARLPCPSPTPGACSNYCPLTWWCHPTISSSVVPFSSCLQFFPALGPFPMSQLFTSGDQSIGVSASASVLSMNIQGWFPLGWTGWISLQSKGLSRVFSNTTVQKHHFFSPQLSLWSNSHMHTRLLEKTIALTRRTLVLQPIADFFQAITFMLKQHCDTDDLTEENKSGILGQGRGGWVSVEERLISVYHLFQVWIRSQHISCSNMTLS